jgi:hypothetical protein
MTPFLTESLIVVALLGGSSVLTAGSAALAQRLRR